MQNKTWNSVADKVNFNLEIDTGKFLQLIPKENSILDYGCGYGRTCEVLSSLGYKNILGVDTSAKIIKRGNLKHPHLSLFQSKNYKINYPENHFNTIILCAVLTCVPEDSLKRKIISEIKRVLVPCGIIHMVEFCSNTEKRFKSSFGIDMHHSSPNFLRELVSEFSELTFDVNQVKTLKGQNALAVNYFGKNDT